MKLILVMLALLCFLLAAVNFPQNRVNLTALGLFFWLLSEVLG